MGTGIVAALEFTNPSVMNVLSAGLTLAIAHPLAAFIIVNVARNTISPYLAPRPSLYTLKGIATGLVEITVNGTVAALIVGNPNLIVQTVNGTIHAVGTGLAIVSSYATAATSTASIAVAAALVPHSLVAPATITAHAGFLSGGMAAISIGKAALMTALAARPIGVTIALTASAFMLAASMSKEMTQAENTPSSTAQQPPLPNAPTATPSKRFRPGLM